jgi:hypothetical protein
MPAIDQGKVGEQSASLARLWQCPGHAFMAQEHLTKQSNLQLLTHGTFPADFRPFMTAAISRAFSTPVPTLAQSQGRQYRSRCRHG